MSRFCLLCSLVGLTLLASVLRLSANSDALALALQTRISDIYAQNRDAVVTVFAAHDPADSEGRASHFVGTGFFISADGIILTNTNVIHGADRIWIERDGVGYLAEAVGSDPLTNVAIIKVRALPKAFQYLRFTEEPSPPDVGSLVVALTSELGMPPGPSMGLINGWNTRYGERVLPTVYLRSDIPLDGGEGGSPVFDINGSLIGMTIVALPEIRSSFILPARAIERIRDDILFSGKVRYAHFGFTTLEVPDRENGRYVIIEELETDGPAALAGIQQGDVLKQVGKAAINSDDDLRAAFFFARPQERINVTVQRGEETLKLPVKVGTRRTPPTAIPVVRKPPENSPGSGILIPRGEASPEPQPQPEVLPEDS